MAETWQVRLGVQVTAPSDPGSRFTFTQDRYLTAASENEMDWLVKQHERFITLMASLQGAYRRGEITENVVPATGQVYRVADAPARHWPWSGRTKAKG